MPNYQHKHEFFELQYVLNGVLRQVIGERELTLRAGDVCFISPGTEHVVYIHDDNTIVVNILIRMETMQSVFTNLLNEDDIISDFFFRVLYSTSCYPYLYCRTEIRQKLTSVIMEMREMEASKIRFKNRLLITKLEEFFIYLLNYHEYDFVTGSGTNETEKKILPVLKYIQTNYKTVTLAELSRYFNYSESYLSRIISLYSENSFSEIVKMLRLKKAVISIAGVFCFR